MARLGGTYLRHSQGGLLNQFIYDNNLAGQRDWVLRGDSSYVDYVYDSRSQLISAKARICEKVYRFFTISLPVFIT